MAERSEYAPGTPSWVDLSSPDPAASAGFYAELFGWGHEEAGPPEQTGGYGFFTLRGKPVAGVGPIQGEGQPPSWTTYLATDDADATARRVREASGTVLVEPMDVMDAGRMAVFADPEGAVFAVWQPGAHQGAAIVSEPGSLIWNELNTRDPDAAKAFYRKVCEWDARPFEQGGGPDYVTWHLAGEERSVGGMLDMRGRVPDEVPPHWMAYFAVDDCDATVSRSQELGGTTTLEPMEVEGVGRFAILTDPQGAHFAVIKPVPSAD